MLKTIIRYNTFNFTETSKYDRTKYEVHANLNCLKDFKKVM